MQFDRATFLHHMNRLAEIVANNKDHPTQVSLVMALTYYLENTVESQGVSQKHIDEAYDASRKYAQRETAQDHDYYAKRINAFTENLDSLAVKYGVATLEYWVERWNYFETEGKPNPKIDLIKEFRSETNCGLRCAKDFIEKHVTGTG